MSGYITKDASLGLAELPLERAREQAREPKRFLKGARGNTSIRLDR